MAGIVNGVLFGTNADFTSSSPNTNTVLESNGLFTDGQIWIGSTAANAGGSHVNVGKVIGSGTINVTYSSPNIVLSAGATIGQTITGNSGSPISPSSGNWNIVTSPSAAGLTFNTSGSGSTLTINTTDASDNIFLGRVSGKVGNTSTDNIGIGAGTFQNVTNAANNVAVGFSALNHVTSGSFNTAVGFQALSTLTTSNGSTAVGYQAMNGGTGLGNTLFGYQAALNLLTGTTNLIMGYTSGTGYVGAESDNILIGHAGVAAEANTMRIGTSGAGTLQVNRTFVAGITGVTVAASAPIGVNTNGQLSSLGFGTATQVLTSNGNGNSPTWNAVTTFIVEGTLTNTQIKNLHGTPVQIIAAPGVGKAIKIISQSSKLVYGGNNAFTNVGAQNILLTYGTNSTSVPILVLNATITATVSTTNLMEPLTAITGASTVYDNIAVNAYNVSATEIAGNAANDNTINYSVVYQIVNL